MGSQNNVKPGYFEFCRGHPTESKGNFQSFESTKNFCQAFCRDAANGVAGGAIEPPTFANLV